VRGAATGVLDVRQDGKCLSAEPGQCAEVLLTPCTRLCLWAMQVVPDMQ
jgi:hypothetical protein